MDVGVGAPGDLPAFVELLEEAGAWLWARGIRQWEPGSHRAQAARLECMLEGGALLLARDGARAGGLAGGCLLTREPGEVWTGRAGDAAYLYKLATARAAAGRGLGAALVEHAEGWARAGGFPLLRLDCWDGNAALRAYYRGLGFTELEAALEYGYRVRLFEKPLA